MTWKEKTCERCVFRVEYQCKRFPPLTTLGPVHNATTYPIVKCDYYMGACAEYAELIEPPKTTEG